MINFRANGLRKACIEKKISFEKLSLLSNTNIKTLHKLEKGTVQLTSKNIINISTALKISYDYLLFGDERDSIVININQLTSKQIENLLSFQAEAKQINLNTIDEYVKGLFHSEIGYVDHNYNFADKCFNIRKNLLGLTQGQLAEYLNINRISVHKWENNSAKATFSMLFTLSCMCGLSINYLYENGSNLEISSYGLNNDSYDIICKINEYYNKQYK